MLAEQQSFDADNCKWSFFAGHGLICNLETERNTVPHASAVFCARLFSRFRWRIRSCSHSLNWSRAFYFRETSRHGSKARNEMNIRSLLILLCAGLFAILLGDQFGAAKTFQEETRRANNGSSSGLALEISWETKYQLFNEVPAAGASSHSAFSAPMASNYEGKLAQLDFWYGIEDEAVRVTITLSFLGPGPSVQTGKAEPQANAELKVSHLLQTDQKVDVNDFSGYGVKPFAIKIVRVKHVDPPLPSFISCTDAIQLVSVKRLKGEFPSFRFTVRNVGSRRINYMEGETDQNSGLGTSGERPVIEAGEQFTFEMGTGTRGQLTGDEYLPDTFASFKVTGVVFDDGDFAGDRKFALFWLQRGTCDRLTMELVVRLLNERIESGATDLRELRSKVPGVCQDVGADEMRKLAARFPESAHNSARISCSEYSDSIARVLLRRIDTFERDHSQSATKEQALDFLKSLRERYLQVLSRWKPRTSDQPSR